MTIGKALLALVLASITCSSLALDAETRYWDKLPLTIALPINQERLLQFDTPIRVLKNEAGTALSLLKVQQALYVKAVSAFAAKRLLVQLASGDVVIINVTAEANVNEVKPLHITTANPEKPAVQRQPLAPLESNALTLTRFAIQTLYVPNQLEGEPSGLHRVPMQTTTTVALFRDATVQAQPLISWQADAYFITAIAVTNLSSEPVTLNPRTLLGQWQTAAFYPSNRLPPRTQKATTTLLLVSDEPFQTAISRQPEHG